MDDRVGEVVAYGSLGNAYESLGKFQEAIEYHNKHLSIAIEVGDRAGEGMAYGNLGNVHGSLGKFREAIEYLNKHLSVATEVGDRSEKEWTMEISATLITVTSQGMLPIQRKSFRYREDYC